MTPIQQMLLGVGGAKKTYMEDVFSTYLYTGSGSSRSITTGVDMSKGGLVWTKGRGAAHGHTLTDTERGVTKTLYSAQTAVETTDTGGVTAFNSNGFSLGTAAWWNNNGNTYSSHSFRKAPGFFDVVTWDGNDTAGRTISHSLGSVPGCVIVKCTTNADSWQVWHRNTGGNQYTLELESSNARMTETGMWNSTAPTASNFTLGDSDKVNGSGRSYVAYVFAGGESTAATATSVLFDGSNDGITIPTHADLAFGNGDFTIECWVRPTGSGTQMIYDGRDNLGVKRVTIYINSDYTVRSQVNNQQKDSRAIPKGQWAHVAVSRSGTTGRFFINGIKEHEWSSSGEDLTAPSSNSYIGRNGNQDEAHFAGKISNFRIVKGTAVYTSSFRPPTEPLTNITNTKLLCCNGSSATASTVTPTTLADTGATASTDSPFDDSAAFTFGENGDQGIIKCGSYIGSGSAGLDVNIGWEPQWILLKRTTAAANWVLADNMRGLSGTGSYDAWYYVNTDAAEVATADILELKSDGFKVRSNGTYFNNDGDTYIWMAIRRPDGYIGKPADAGTGVFTMDTGNSSGTIPTYDSGFAVDFAFHRQVNDSSSWNTSARLITPRKLVTNSDNNEVTDNNNTFDSNVGWAKNNGADSNFQSWMWKRHAGFDVLTYYATAVAGLTIPHNLSKIPEMMWIKRRDGAAPWLVYHKGLDGGTNPETHYLLLNTTDAESDSAGMFNDVAPTATHFTVGSSSYANNSAGDYYIAMLFATIPKISAVGSYTGTGVNSNPYGPSISLDFQPRFIMIKNASNTADWGIWDSSRSLGSETSQRLLLNTNAAQYGVTWIRDVNSSGFKIYNDDHEINTNNETYIYYAHA